MQPRPWPDVPELTARMARSSSPKGNLATRIREDLSARCTPMRGLLPRSGCGAAGDLPDASVLSEFRLAGGR